jgi:hypothetical protein
MSWIMALYFTLYFTLSQCHFSVQVLGDRQYKVIIADESHYLKSPDAKRTQVISKWFLLT